MAFRTPKMKLLGSLRGRGVLKAEGRSFEVDYELDRYQHSGGQVADGSLNGDLSPLADLPESSPATLVLENGSEMPVLVSNAGDDGADFTASGETLHE